MIRFLDIIFSGIGLLIFSPILILICLLVFSQERSNIFSREVGRNKKSFILLKFRTMHKNTPSLASHLVKSSAVTKMGGFQEKANWTSCLSF